MANVVRQGPILDLVAFDKNDQPVLAVEVKAVKGFMEIGVGWLNQLEAMTEATGHPIPFWMFADPDRIMIFSVEGFQQARVMSDSDNRTTLVPQPIFDESSEKILSAFEPEFGKKRIFHDYLLALVQAWLWDFILEWRFDQAIALRELIEIGLAERLKGGTTEREVSIADLDPIRRNQFRDEPFLWAGSGD